MTKITLITIPTISAIKLKLLNILGLMNLLNTSFTIQINNTITAELIILLENIKNYIQLILNY